MKKSLSYLIPSLADIFFICIFLYLCLSEGGGGLLGDGDTGYHIRAGEFILDTLSIPRQDIFSYLTPPLHWTAHEWLSEVIMALVHRASGLTGVVVFFAFMIAATYSLLFRVLRKEKFNVLLTVVILVLVLASSQIHWLARPHIFSLFFMIIWYHLLDDYQYHNRNRLYFLPALMVLWVNLHGGYIIGLLLLGIYLFSDVMIWWRVNDEDKPEYVGKVKGFSLIFLACIMVSLVNPYGYQILLFPFQLSSNREIIDYVSEFQSPNFHEPIIFTYLFLFALATFALSKKRLNIIELILVLLFTYMSLFSARYIPLFGIIVAPIVIKQFDFMIREAHGSFADGLKKRADRIASTDASAQGYLWPGIAVVAIVIFLAVSGAGYSFDEKIKPVAAAEFLDRERLEGHMFNNDEFGDYVIYRLYPEYRVFIDGRLDMYGKDILKEYYQVIRLEPEWETVLKKYDVNYIFYNSKTALSQFLLERDDWKLIYSDPVANIFMRNIPENREVIEKYKNTKPYQEEKKADY
jgi:hypothetical protein